MSYRPSKTVGSRRLPCRHAILEVDIETDIAAICARLAAGRPYCSTMGNRIDCLISANIPVVRQANDAAPYIAIFRRQLNGISPLSRDFVIESVSYRSGIIFEKSERI